MNETTFRFESDSTEKTEALGKALAKLISDLPKKSAFIALRGEMGVGKTAFTRGFASYFDIKGVKSPTYALLNEYRGKTPIFHFDMYRIESEDDLISIGYDEYIERDGYVLCEWSENIDEFLPNECIFVKIERSDKGTEIRNIEITARGLSLPLREGELKT